NVRIIPSLHGGLFRFDGESVEAVPFDADQLLSSSFRLSDETVLVGGKETSTSGIDVFSGRVLYTCTANGCDKQQNVHDSSDLLIVKRQQQVVRSIMNRNGNENWNFSVGEMNLDYSQGTNLHLLEGSADHANKQTHDVSILIPANLNQFSMEDSHRIKIVVPDGMVCLVTKANDHVISWKQKLGSPVSSAWLLVGGVLRKLNLFDPTLVPALEESTAVAKIQQRKSIYMGKYINLHLLTCLKKLEFQFRQMSPKFTYRRCHGDVNSVAIENNKDDPTTQLVVKGKPPQKASCVHGLTLYNEQFHKGGGQYLYYAGYYLQDDTSYLSKIQNSKKMGRNTVDSLDNASYNNNIDIVYSSFMHWWKELCVLTVSISIIVQCFINKCMHAFKARSENIDTSSSLYETPPEQPPTIEVAREYESRFINDFQPLECLGKGGFGIVFKARNKVDDCTYAVKRIMLPNNKSSREKVLREVRALAKLDHPSIVRYFNSWNEEPPVGWQKARDAHAWSHSSLPVTSDKPLSKKKESTLSSSGTDHRITDFSSSLEHVGNDEVISDRFCTQGFAVSKTTPEKTSDSGLFDEQINDSWGNNESWDNGQEIRSNLGGKFFQSDSSISQSVIRNRNNNRTPSIPFARYNNQDSMSVVFDDEAQPGVLHTHNEVFPINMNFWFPDSSTSDLKAVVCMKDQSTGQVARLGHCEEENKSGDSTMYLYIQMQLCKKESLREWLASNVGSRDFNYCLHIFQQVASAVAYVHDCGLIHRDLKPSNVLFSLDGSIKVGDFGLVTHTDGDSFLTNEESPDAVFSTDDIHTQRVGTRMYMAPELMTSGAYSEKIDIFALGLIFFELIISFGTQMERILHLSDARRLKFPITFMNNYPNEVRLLVLMLSGKADDRPSAIEISQHEIFDEI
uniref:non-specific serine/threonine protein kinase n=1 Tax=Ciona savignyi TaxID=51511 RepID=H2YXJ0_CIOSA